MAYVEAFLADKLPEHVKSISFNRIFNDQTDQTADECLRNKMLCIDGLQRLSSMLSFINGEFNVFNGQISYQDCVEHQVLDLISSFKFEIYEIKNYDDLLRFYIDMNSGGTVHSKNEIERVMKMIKSK